MPLLNIFFLFKETKANPLLTSNLRLASTIKIQLFCTIGKVNAQFKGMNGRIRGKKKKGRKGKKREEKGGKGKRRLERGRKGKRIQRKALFRFAIGG